MNRDPHDPNLPLGYRWATDEEIEQYAEPMLGYVEASIVYCPHGIYTNHEVRRLARLDGLNMKLLTERLAALNERQGPRVGDFVVFADGIERRFTHDHDEHGLQTTDARFGSASFHLGDGFLNYSGSLRPPVKRETLRPLNEVRYGWAWFFHHDWPQAHHAVHVSIPLRVFACTLVSEEN